MASEDDDLWQALLAVTGDQVATEADYEHGYKREMRSDLLRYVTFMIGTEIYGLPIEQIVEISTAFPTTSGAERRSSGSTRRPTLRGRPMARNTIGRCWRCCCATRRSG